MSNKIELDDEEKRFTEEDMCHAYSSGYCAGQYRGQVGAIERVDEFTKRACRFSFTKWLRYANYED